MPLSGRWKEVGEGYPSRSGGSWCGHREEDMVRAHVLVCMLACHVQWRMEKELKAATKRAEDDQPAHSFATLLEDLATLCRITIRPAVSGADSFHKLTELTAVQAKALTLLGVTPKAIPACSQ